MQKRLPGVVGAVADVDGDEEAVGGTHEGGTLEKYSGVKVGSSEASVVGCFFSMNHDIHR